MLRLELSSTRDNIIEYKYFPEDEKDFGVVTLNKITGELSLVELSKREKDDGWRWYANHTFPRLREYYRKQEFKKEDLVAWY